MPSLLPSGRALLLPRPPSLALVMVAAIQVVLISNRFLCSCANGTSYGITINSSCTHDGIRAAIAKEIQPATGSYSLGVYLDVSNEDALSSSYNIRQLQALVDNPPLKKNIISYTIQANPDRQSASTQATFRCNSTEEVANIQTQNTHGHTMVFNDLIFDGCALSCKDCTFILQLRNITVTSNASLSLDNLSSGLGIFNLTVANFSSAFITSATVLTITGMHVAESSSVVLNDCYINSLSFIQVVNVANLPSDRGLTAALTIRDCNSVNMTDVHFENNEVPCMQLINPKGTTKMLRVRFKNNSNIQHGSTGAPAVSVQLSIKDTTFIMSDSWFQSNTLHVSDLTQLSGAAVSFFATNTASANISFKNCCFFSNVVNVSETVFQPERDSVAQTGGGAVSISFQTVENSIVALTNCRFEGNKALWGGGLAIDVWGNSSVNKITISNSNFSDNSVLPPWYSVNLDRRLVNQPGRFHGGGCAVLIRNFSLKTSVQVEQTRFSSNTAVRGGAMMIGLWDEAERSEIAVKGNLQWINNSTGEEPVEERVATEQPIAVSNCRFSDNKAQLKEGHPQGRNINGIGGALNIELHDRARLSNITLVGCVYDGNNATEGGGIYTGFYGEETGTIFRLQKSLFQTNTAITGAGISLWADDPVPVPNKREVQLADLNFTSNVAYFRGSLSVTSLEYNSSGNMTLYNNTNSAVHIRNTISNLQGHILYRSNVGQVGAGLFSSESTTVVYENSSAEFFDNIALGVGGGMFAYTSTRTIQVDKSPHIPDCFLVYEDRAIDPNKIPEKFYSFFDGNVAGQTGSAIYIPDILPCTWAAFNPSIGPVNWTNLGSNYINHELAPLSFLDGVPGASCLELAYPNINAWDQSWLPILPQKRPILTEKGKAVATDAFILGFHSPSEGVTCDDLYNPKEDINERMNPTPVVPGFPTNLQGIACDQRNQTGDVLLYLTLLTPSNQTTNDVSAVLLTSGRHTLLSSTTNSTDPITFVVKDRSAIKQNFTIHATTVGTVRVVTAKLHIQVQPCPPGYDLDTNGGHALQCKCQSRRGQSNLEHLLQCLSVPDHSLVISKGFWAYSNGVNVSITPCPPGYCSDHRTSGDGWVFKPEDPNDQCEWPRSGILCGSCRNDTVPSLALYSGKCIENDCWDWSLSLVATFVAVLIIVLFFLWLDVPLSNEIRGLLFFCSVARMLFHPTDTFILKISSAGVHSHYAWLRYIFATSDFSWSSDYCFYPITNAVEALQAGYIVPVFVILIVMFAHIFSSFACCGRLPNILRCDKRGIWNATWLFAYYPFAHMLEISVLLLSWVHIPYLEHNSMRFYWDGDIAYFGKEHKVAAGLAIAILVLLLLFVVIIGLLASGRTPQCCRNRAKLRVASTVLCVGLKNKSYCKLWWVWDLLRRVIILAIYVPKDEDYVPWFKQHLIISACVVFLVVHILVQPYEEAKEEDHDKVAFYSIPGTFLRKHCNFVEGVVLGFMVIISLLSTDSLDPPLWQNSKVRLVILTLLVAIPQLTFYIIVLWKIGIIFRHHLLQHGYCRCRHQPIATINHGRQEQRKRKHYSQLREEILGFDESYGSDGTTPNDC